MKKSELVAAVAEKAGLTKKDVDNTISAITDVIAEALADGDKVSLVGFGTFSVKERKARDGVNPFTGEKIRIAASKAPSFKAGKSLKDTVNK
jgi:DNA-binding protein HU-beta